MNTAKVLTQSSSRGIPFDILRAYGIGDDIIDIWKKSYGEILLPIQEKAIVKHNVLGGKNVIVFAPTSSGKTLVGEIVSVHYAMAKKRALYLVPMKALAEEKYHHYAMAKKRALYLVPMKALAEENTITSKRCTAS